MKSVPSPVTVTLLTTTTARALLWNACMCQWCRLLLPPIPSPPLPCPPVLHELHPPVPQPHSWHGLPLPQPTEAQVLLKEHAQGGTGQRYICMYVRMYVCVRVHTYVCARVCTCVCTYVFWCCKCTYVCNVCTYIRTSVHSQYVSKLRTYIST